MKSSLAATTALLGLGVGGCASAGDVLTSPSAQSAPYGYDSRPSDSAFPGGQPGPRADQMTRGNEPGRPTPSAPDAMASPFAGGADAPAGPGDAFGAGSDSPFAPAPAPAPAPAAGLGGSLAGAAGALTMIGDGPSLSIRQQFPTFPGAPGVPPPNPPNAPPSTPDPRRASSLIPSVRALKVAENQSPRPQDRVYFTYNYFDNLNESLNRRFESPLKDINASRYIFGLEKTFDEGRGSIGLRLPLNTITASPAIPSRFNTLAGTYTALNDLSIIGKYVLKQDPETGSLISAGLVVTPPTGPRSFAGAKFLDTPHTTQVQPFLGYIWNRGDVYLHGFSAIDFPINPNQVTIMYNDLGIGYRLYRGDGDRLVSSVTPTFEGHVNTPLNHRDAYNPDDPAGTPDVVDLTFGVHVGLRNRSLLTLGVVTPVTGPRPFDVEAVVLFNMYFGGSRGNRRPLPVVGG